MSRARAAAGASAPAGPRLPSEALPLRLVLVLGAMSAFGPLSIDMYLPSLPAIATALSSSAAGVQLTLTACTVGLGVGQLVAGPLSDAYGRRRPLMAGLVLFVVFSLACAVAPTLPLLVGCRFLQALGGSAGIVISRAIARDLRSGPGLVRLFAMLMVVNGTAPILAPVIGGQLVQVTSWRGVFVALAVFGAVLLVAALQIVPDSLPPERRLPGRLTVTLAAYRTLLGDRRFVLYVLSGGLSFATMFAYISGSPFVLETLYGLSPQQFSAAFAVNASAIVAAGLVVRTRPEVAVLTGLGVLTVGAGTVLLAALTGAGLPMILPGFLLVTAGFGATAPSMGALAMNDHPDIAGSASAVLGAAAFLIGGLLGPLPGLGGSDSAVPLGVVLVGIALAALLTGILATRAQHGAGG